MKKLLFITIVLFFSLIANSQVFNTSGILKTHHFSVGVEPVIFAEGNTDFILFGHIGYGLAKKIDLSAKAGFLYNNQVYLGGDVEFGLNKHFSISAGAHQFGDFGLDMTFLGSWNLTKSAVLFGGIDADAMLPEGDVYFPLWMPIGVEIAIGKNTSFIMEADVALTPEAWHMFGGGLSVYF